MREKVLAYVKVCDSCGASYIETIGETCRCPTPMYEEEPPRNNWDETLCAEQDA